METEPDWAVGSAALSVVLISLLGARKEQTELTVVWCASRRVSRTAERNRINKLNKKASLDEERTQFSRWLRQECCQSWTPVINNHLHELVARSITPRERTLQNLVKERGKQKWTVSVYKVWRELKPQGTRLIWLRSAYQWNYIYLIDMFIERLLKA